MNFNLPNASQTPISNSPSGLPEDVNSPNSLDSPDNSLTNPLVNPLETSLEKSLETTEPVINNDSDDSTELVLKESSYIRDGYFQYSNYTNQRLTPLSPSSLTINADDGKVLEMFLIALNGMYGPDERTYNDDFLFEFCEVTSEKGIQSRKNGKKIEHSMMVKFKDHNDEHVKCVNSLEQLYLGAAHILHAYRNKVKLHDFVKEKPKELKPIVYRPRDELGQYVQGVSKSMFLKLIGGDSKTLFTPPIDPRRKDEKGRIIPVPPIEWSRLSNVEVTFIPLMRIKDILVNTGLTKASIRMEMVSAIVTGVKLKNSESRQISSIMRLNQERPNIVDTVDQQIAKINLLKQDQLLDANDQGRESEDGNTESFAEINKNAEKLNIDDVTKTAPIRKYN